MNSPYDRGPRTGPRLAATVCVRSDQAVTSERLHAEGYELAEELVERALSSLERFHADVRDRQFSFTPEALPDVRREADRARHAAAALLQAAASILKE